MKGIRPLIRTLGHEALFAARALRRAPGFSLIVVATMGVGVGANAAIFNVVHSVLLDPLPYDDPDELVWVVNRYDQGGTGAISAPEFWEYRQSRPALEGLVALTREASNLTGVQPPLLLQGLAVSPGYFALLGVTPRMGRAFAREEERPDASPVVILSHGLWTTAFGGDPTIIGKVVRLQDLGRTVVGVMGSEHEALMDRLSPDTRTDFWVPLVLDPTAFDLRLADRHNLSALGRLAESGDHTTAEAGLTEAVRRVERTYPGLSNTGKRDVAVIDLHQRVAGDVTRLLAILSATATLVLALACVNVTHLLLARAESRTSEVVIRSALGAGRGNLAVTAVAEGIVIGLVGAVTGLGLAIVGTRGLVRLLPEARHLVGGSGLGVWTIVFSLALAAVAGSLAGLAPGIRAWRLDVASSLKAGGAGAFGPSRNVLRRSLVVVQVAGAVVLVVGAALLTRSVIELRAVDPGFTTEGLHLVRVNAPPARYDSVELIRFLYESIEAEVAALPGVESVSTSWQTPLQSGMSDWPVMAEPVGGSESEWLSADPNQVGLSYFETYGIPLVAGRYFEPADLDRPEGAVVLNEAAARSLWPDGDAVGRRVNVDFSPSVWREVVGVVADERARGFREAARPQTYLTFAPGPFSQNPSLTLTIRSRMGAATLRPELLALMAAIDPEIPIGPVTDIGDQVAASMSAERVLSVLLGAFGALALLLGLIGVYGLMAYDVQQRRREIGVRITMGAPRATVLRSTVSRALVLGVIGTLFGLAGAVGAGRLFSALLYGVTGTDTTTLTVVSLAVLAAITAAAYGPASRAAGLDPLEALRER